MALLTPLIGQEFLDRYRLRRPLNVSLRYGVKVGFSVAANTNRQLKRLRGVRGGAGPSAASGTGYFDLTPDDDQRQLMDVAERFAEDVLRPAAGDADDAGTYPPELIGLAAQLGLTGHWSSVSTALVAEALAYGDMGSALAVLAPAGVASALTRWGSAGQQDAYLPRFAGADVPQACVAIAEPYPLFDPTALKCTAERTPRGYRLSGVKSLVPGATRAELLIIAAQLNGKPALFVVEPSAKGVSVKSDPSMGLRSAALGQVQLSNVSLPLAARLGEQDAHDADYLEAVALARLGWAALAVGTCHAVLDHVVPYVKEAVADGEPIAHRQSVAFICANIAIELDGLRLTTWRGAARADQGLPFAREAALAKRFGTERAMQIGSDGVQLLGRHGCTGKHPVERWYRDLRAFGVAEGVVVL